jgi:RNA polymerase sigma-70 factor (ECF subfamily)
MYLRDDGQPQAGGSSRPEVIDVDAETETHKPCILDTEEADDRVYRLQDEVSLLRASLDGETAAWGEIVSRYKDAVFGLCLGFLRNRADAEDVTHDAFIRAYNNLRRYHLDKRFSTWMFTIAANLCRNRLRYRRNHPVVETPTHLIGGSDPATIVAKEDREARVRKALDRLPNAYRAPLVLRFYNDLSYREIGDVLSIPEGTVKTRIHRGKAMLRNLIGEERDR